MAKPVYVTTASRKMDAGARAWSMDFVMEAMKRNSMDMDMVTVKEMRRKKKYGPASRRRCPMKYIVVLRKIVLRIL